MHVPRSSPLQQLPVPDSYSRLERWHFLRRRDGESVGELFVGEEELWTQMHNSLKRARSDRGHRAEPTHRKFHVSLILPLVFIVECPTELAFRCDNSSRTKHAISNSRRCDRIWFIGGSTNVFTRHYRFLVQREHRQPSSPGRCGNLVSWNPLGILCCIKDVQHEFCD